MAGMCSSVPQLLVGWEGAWLPNLPIVPHGIKVHRPASEASCQSPASKPCRLCDGSNCCSSNASGSSSRSSGTERVPLFGCRQQPQEHSCSGCTVATVWRVATATTQQLPPPTMRQGKCRCPHRPHKRPRRRMHTTDDRARARHNSARRSDNIHSITTIAPRCRTSISHVLLQANYHSSPFRP